MILLEKFKWLAYRRPLLRKHHSWAHWKAYIDKHSKLKGQNKINAGAIVLRSQIGRFTYVAAARVITAEVGSFCSIGPQVMIGLGIHPTNWLSTHPAFFSTLGQAGSTFAKKNLFTEVAKTHIGNDVWIAAGAIIMGGITIGNGAIIAAGAIVTKNVAPYSIVGGVPARLIRFRFKPEVIKQLQDWCWWNLPDEVLADVAEEFCNRDHWTVEDIKTIQEKCTTRTKPQLQVSP